MSRDRTPSNKTHNIITGLLRYHIVDCVNICSYSNVVLTLTCIIHISPSNRIQSVLDHLPAAVNKTLCFFGQAKAGPEHVCVDPYKRCRRCCKAVYKRYHQETGSLQSFSTHPKGTFQNLPFQHSPPQPRVSISFVPPRLLLFCLPLSSLPPQ